MVNTEYTKNAGIYKLTCLNNGKIYIGKSVSLKTRISYHKNCATKVRDKGYLKRAISKYGWEAFNVEIIEIFENFDKKNDDHKNMIVEREAYYIKLFDSTNKEIGYNICKFSTDRTGMSLSEEAKEHLRGFHLGKKVSKETREKISNAKRGKKLSDEHRQKLKDAKTPMTEEHRAKLLKSNLGRKMSEETKEKIRQFRLGSVVSEATKEKLRRPHSEETREKLRQLNLGRKHSEESIEKMRKVKLGKKHSPESIEKMRQAKLGKKKKSKLEEIEHHVDTATNL